MYLCGCAHQHHCHTLGWGSSRCAALTLAAGFILLLEALTATVIFILRDGVESVAVGVSDTNAVLCEMTGFSTALADFFDFSLGLS